MEGHSWKNANFSKYKTPWNSWYFKNGKLWDEHGNSYSQKILGLVGNPKPS